MRTAARRIRCGASSVGLRGRRSVPLGAHRPLGLRSVRHCPGTYPFPTILESNIPPDYSNWLYYYQQHPHDLPTYKSKLTVDIRDLGLDPTSRMVLREMVGSRFDHRTHHVSFVSKNLPSAAANENRVFQMLDACLLECRRIGKEMNEAGFYAKTNGAVHNRLLKPPPTLNKAKGKKEAAASSEASAAAAGSDAAAAAPAATADAAAVDGPKKVNYTKSQRHYRALGMQSPSTDKVLTPTNIKGKVKAKPSIAAQQPPAQQQQQAATA